MKKICWGDHVTNEEVLQSVKEEKNILQAIKRKKANGLRRNYLLKHVTEGKGRGKDISDGKTRKKT